MAAEPAVQKGVQPGVDVAGARSHHQALKLGQSHRRLNRHATAYRRCRAAVPQMQHDLIQFAKITANQLRGRARYELMMCVEPIAPDRYF